MSERNKHEKRKGLKEGSEAEALAWELLPEWRRRLLRLKERVLREAEKQRPKDGGSS